MEIHPRVNYFVDLFLGISFVFSVLSGVIMFFVPWGSDAVLLGISRGSWPLIHEISSFAMVGLVFLHLVLHLRWIGSMTKGFFIRKK
jgi:hypothetical protein